MSLRVLLSGVTGWIGSQMELLMKRDGIDVIPSKSRLENFTDIRRELLEIKPDRVLICSGLTGRPNIDWCEDHKEEVNRVNVLGVINLVNICEEFGIHVTYFGTGCIYEYDSEHPIGGKGFTELDWPNFTKSYYSLTKIITEKSISTRCLVLRIRMPLSDDLHPRNFITKIKNYSYVVNVPNSMTVLHDLLPVALDMMKRKTLGVYNFCNPGTIDHNTILKLYQTYIDPKFTWKNFSLEDQAKILKAGRSNNSLDVTKLLNLYPNIPSIEISIKRLFKRMKRRLGK